MNNTVILFTVLATNWLPITVQQPNGDGSTKPVNKEVGILVSNQMARVVTGKTTNTILVSSEVVPPKEFLLRDQPQYITLHSATNFSSLPVRWHFPQ